MFFLLKNISNTLLDPEAIVTFKDMYKFCSAWSFNNLTPASNASSTLPSLSVVLRKNHLYPQSLFITDSLLYRLPVVSSVKSTWQKYVNNAHSMTSLSRNFKKHSTSYYPNHTFQSVEWIGLQNYS